MPLSRLSVLVLAVVCCHPTSVSDHPGPVPMAIQDSNGASTTPSSDGNWVIVDLMPLWWAYWDKAKELPSDQRATLFETEVVAHHPELFGETVIGRDPTAAFELRPRLDAFLDEVESLLPAMRKVSVSVQRELPAHRRSFERAFPAFHWTGKVYFTISLDAFDGAIRKVDGVPALLFGVDKIARLHGDEANLAPLFHHELFHVLHLVLSTPFAGSPENKMYQALWAEGLAVLVSKRLNPTATAKQLVLDDEMVQRGDKQLSQLAREMLDHIDSSDPAFFRDWFRGSGQREDIPVRVGYYLGLRVAEVVGRTRSLSELAQLQDPELRKLIAEALRELADGPSSESPEGMR